MGITRHIPIAVFCGALLFSTASCEHQPVPSPAVAAEWCCMLKNIYHEARGEGVAGMQAVAVVTLNRVAQTGNTICDTVYARKQFSWTNTAKGRNKPIEGDTSVLYAVASQAMTGGIIDFTNGATHYHTTKVKPVWRRALDRVAVVNNHIFYRNKQ
jgi:spore germination cell wall hydrolase CwlJ-like protein